MTEVGVYDRTRRYVVGERELDLDPVTAVIDQAVTMAWDEARQRWAMPNDEVDYTVTIFTAQVLVELRWRP